MDFSQVIDELKKAEIDSDVIRFVISLQDNCSLFSSSYKEALSLLDSITKEYRHLKSEYLSLKDMKDSLLSEISILKKQLAQMEAKYNDAVLREQQYSVRIGELESKAAEYEKLMAEINRLQAEKSKEIDDLQRSLLEKTKELQDTKEKLATM